MQAPVRPAVSCNRFPRRSPLVWTCRSRAYGFSALPVDAHRRDLAWRTGPPEDAHRVGDAAAQPDVILSPAGVNPPAGEIRATASWVDSSYEGLAV
jgi:hypothetical protein